jgi:tRNA A-37 threonylcarbamoyl transferase component Bud32
MEPSVEAFCNTLAETGLMTAEQVRDLYQHCQSEAPAACTDLERFLRWLVKGEHLTEYQIGVIRRGSGHQLVLGPYKILERVGKGRMAGVYKAVHELGQVVAIKVLPPSKARDPQILGRFQRESRLALRLKHPNIVRTFQTGHWQDLHGLVMEYLEGETLEEVLERRGRLQPGEAVRVVCQALNALQEIHEEGLVHRDLKPGNLMLVGGDARSTLQATVKVLDIGLGRALFDEDPSGKGQNFELTNEGDVLGTPAYMAPEQARDPHRADVRSDIYSLGCTLYHALAGRPPFPDANPARQLIRHATEEPQPIRSFFPAMPVGLPEVVSQMMAKDPSQRFATPQKAAAALQSFLVAGAEVVGIERQPRMAAYLRWLAGQWSDESRPPAVQRILAAPKAAAILGAQPAPPPPAPPPPAAAPHSATILEFPAAPAPPRRAKKRKPARPPAVPQGPPEVVEPVRVVRHGKPRQVEMVPVPEVSPTPGVWLSGRDLAMLGIGIGAIALLAGVIVTIVLLAKT